MDKAYELIDGFVNESKRILKDNLVGIYLHGSLAMGCFNPKKSDIDLLVVIDKDINNDIKKEFMDMVIRLNPFAPNKGIEMSVVKRSVCNPFIYPTPFELHFSLGHLDSYLSNPYDYILKMKGKDKDLAAHFTILLNRGKSIYGLGIDEVFGEVSKEYYIDSIWFDIKDAKKDILSSPMYMILNLARVLAYLKDNMILSKEEGGAWAKDNIPPIYHELILMALDEYIKADSIDYDKKVLKKYAKYMLKEIKNLRRRLS